MTPFSFSWWRALGLSIRGHFHGAPRIVKLAVLPVMMSLFAFGFFLSLAHFGDISLSEEGEQTPARTMTIGSRVAYGIAKRLHATASTPAPASSTALVGYKVSVRAPLEKKRLAEQILRSMGASITSSPAAAIVLVHENDNWSLSSKDPVLAVLALSLINKEIQAATSAADDVPMEYLVQVAALDDFNQKRQASFAHRNEIFPRVMAWALMIPLLLMVWMSCAKVCHDVDRARASGLLEAFVLSPMPFHVYLLGQAIMQGLVVGVLAMAVLTLAGAFVGFMNPISLVLAGAVFAVISASLGLLGALQVLWFHHRVSRVVGAFFLNPLASPFFILFVILFVSSSKAAMWSTTRAFRSIPLMDCTPLQALGWLGISLLVCGAFMAVLCLIIEARLGPRRTGLARI